MNARLVVMAGCLFLGLDAGFDLGWMLRATAARRRAFEGGFVNGGVLGDVDGAADVFRTRLELNRRAGSGRDAPLAKVSLTTDL